jgi:hypothetical protein
MLDQENNKKCPECLEQPREIMATRPSRLLEVATASGDHHVLRCGRIGFCESSKKVRDVRKQNYHKSERLRLTFATGLDLAVSAQVGETFS